MKLKKNTGIDFGFFNYFRGEYCIGYYHQPTYLKVYFHDDVEIGYEEYNGKTFYI
jgi:hypothetical protein